MTTTDTIQCTGKRYPVNADEPDGPADIHHDGPCPVHHDPEQIARTLRQLVDATNALPPMTSKLITLAAYRDMVTFAAILTAVEALGGDVIRTADDWQLVAKVTIGECQLTVSHAGGVPTREVTETVTKTVAVWPDEVQS